ncbi:MAG: hypothetical protein KJ995_00255 [Candidatus Omnitrophica bacterium]|nr:hypothetical protein [Candidatus Omnitrophota bacterium]MBU1127466.1 hypothetical protein [Candidatus Omnitrophota bacterium]MBU1850825.1 hypothetical protein [Candidatus Omnitrophota bacterium]
MLMALKGYVNGDIPFSQGAGPGLVKGAKGNGGKLTGACFDPDLMYKKMCESFKDSDA